MRAFTELYRSLDETTSTNAKVDALADYFERAPAGDSAWAVYFLCGDSLKSPVRMRTLAGWATEYAQITDWMFESCYETVGDLAETIALLATARPNRVVTERWEPTLEEAVAWIVSLRGVSEDDQKAVFLERWGQLEVQEIFVLGKLLTGALRVGVSRKLVTKALALKSGVDHAVIAHRLMGHWKPTAAGYEGLFNEDASDADRSRPYPYFLAAPLTGEPKELGVIGEWQAEWKWDGIRGQLVRRGSETFLWSRGEELVTEQFPEIAEAAEALPDGTVIDGEIMAWNDGPMTFKDLQRRLGRKKVGKKIRQDVPCRFIAYDIMERNGEDLRETPLGMRRAELEGLIQECHDLFGISEIVEAPDWEGLAELRAESRDRGVEGLMLKRKDSPYRVGRVIGDWWKWKVAPYEIDAVMIYAQAGHGRRANLNTDYTFAVWNEERELVPIAKAYSGLSDEEIRELDRWIRAHTIDKFGPVRAVEPLQVFQLNFENVAVSARHKSGVAVRFPRIARWRKDKVAADAATLEDVRGLIR